MNGNYCDVTSFELAENTWNGWVKGPNGVMLEVAEASGNHYARFENFTGNLLGIIIEKTITELTAGVDYCISIRLKRLGQSDRTPTLTWLVDGAQQGLPLPVECRDWHVLRTRFKASSSTHRVMLQGRDSIGQDNGADFCFDDLRIYPAQLEEDFSGHQQKIIKPGEQLDGRCMVISLLPDAYGQSGIQIHTTPVDGMQQGEGLVLSRNVSNQDPPQQVHIRLKGEYSSVQFSWTWIHHPASVEFLDHKGESLGSIDVLPAQGLHQRLSFETENAEDYVSELLITCSDFSYLDNFKFEAK